jgi:hypothetical protein
MTKLVRPTQDVHIVILLDLDAASIVSALTKKRGWQRGKKVVRGRNHLRFQREGRSSAPTLSGFTSAPQS